MAKRKIATKAPKCFRPWPELLWSYYPCEGAGFVVPVAGAISLMPGTASDPAYRRIDVDTKTGKVKGVF